MDDYTFGTKIIQESIFHLSLSPEGEASIRSMLRKALEYGRSTPYADQDRRRRVFEQVALEYLHDGLDLPGHEEAIASDAEFILSASEAFSKKENK